MQNFYLNSESNPIQNQTSILGDWKEPEDQTHVTITQTWSQTLVNNWNIVYCCVLNILFVFIFLNKAGFIYVMCIT